MDLSRIKFAEPQAYKFIFNNKCRKSEHEEWLKSISSQRDVAKHLVIKKKRNLDSNV